MAVCTLQFHHPDLFGSVVSHSSVLDMERIVGPKSKSPVEFQRIFGPNAVGGPEDVFALAQQLGDNIPAIRFDCGTEDGLIEHNRALHAHLERLNIPHEYAEYPGTHNWAYWDEHIQEAIAFHWRTLGAG